MNSRRSYFFRGQPSKKGADATSAPFFDNSCGWLAAHYLQLPLQAVDPGFGLVDAALILLAELVGVLRAGKKLEVGLQRGNVVFQLVDFAAQGLLLLVEGLLGVGAGGPGSFPEFGPAGF